MRHILFAITLFLLLSPESATLFAQEISIPETIEWTWEVRPPNPDSKLPNVALLGDSITRNYFKKVVTDLAGVANVYLMATSASVGDPRLLHQIEEFAALEGVQFQVVHFNNGMHGWKYTEEQYKAAFPGYLQAVQKIAAPGGILIWSTITPVSSATPGGATNSRIEARNAIADSFTKPEGIAIDDQYALMMKHQDLHSDPVHFNSDGSNIQGEQVAKLIGAAVAQKEHASFRELN